MTRTCIIDSSSAILLYKAGIFEELSLHYRTICPPAVITELTINHLQPGAEYFHICCDSKRLLIGYPEPADIKNVEEWRNGLGPGEVECIALYYKKAGDFIILDDRKGALFCKKNNIPYINALLVPKILFFSGFFSEAKYNLLSSLLFEEGRYSEKISQYASNMQIKDLSEFLIN